MFSHNSIYLTCENCIFFYGCSTKQLDALLKNLNSPHVSATTQWLRLLRKRLKAPSLIKKTKFLWAGLVGVNYFIWGSLPLVYFTLLPNKTLASKMKHLAIS